MAYQTINTQTINGTTYNLQYDGAKAEVQLIQQNAPAGTQPLFLNGKFNTAAASQLGLTAQEQQNLYGSIQSSVKNAHSTGGGNSNGLNIPAWAAKGNTGTPPGTTTPAPAQAASPNSGNQQGGNSFGNIFDAITDIPGALKDVSITNGNYGPTNQYSLFKSGMKYPIDMKTQYQDHVAITQYQYQPPLADQLLSGNFQGILTGGMQKTSNFSKEKIIGTCYLPMPNSFNDGMSVGWGPDQMNNLTAAIMTDVIKNPGQYAGGAGLGAVVSTVMGGGVGGGAQAGASALALTKILSSGAGSAEGKSMVGATAASKLLQLAQFGVDVDSILARTAGVVPNSNLELMFGGPQLRSLSLSYKMTARDEQEAKTIRKILRFFKQGSAPKKKTGSAGQQSYFLGTPNVFKLQFKTGGSQNKAVSMYKTMACTTVQTNYTAAGGMWAAYDGGQPVAVEMSLTFAELEPIFDTDYQTSVFDNTGLDPVADDAVGY